MSSGKKEDTPSSDDDDEKIMLKKLSKRVSASSSDNDSEESYEEEYGDSDEDDSFIDREKRQIYEYDDEDVSFDYDEGTTSSIDDLEHLEYQEEDEIMQVVVDEHGTANVAIVDDYGELDDDDDVIIPMEDQSIKTEAEIGSEIFESSPYNPIKEEDEDPPSLKTTLKSVTQQFVRATLLLGQPFEEEKVKSMEQTLSGSREKSVSIPSLHVDRELMKITDTYVRVTNSLGMSKSRSETSISTPSKGFLEKSVSQQNSTPNMSSSKASVITAKEVVSIESDKKGVAKVLGKLGKSMISITKRIGRSFSTTSLSSTSQRRASMLSERQRSASEKSLISKSQQGSLHSKQSSIVQPSVTGPSSKTSSGRSSLIKSKSLSNIIAPDSETTPILRNSLQKITEDVILVTKCLESPIKKKQSIEKKIVSTEQLVKSENSSTIDASEPSKKETDLENEDTKDKDLSSNSENKSKSNSLDPEKNLENEDSPGRSTDQPVKREIHPYIKKILKKEESMEISKVLIESHKEDLERERLVEEGMTFKNSLKTITHSIMTVTNLLGTNPDAPEEKEEIKQSDAKSSSEETFQTEDLKTFIPMSPETPDIKKEIKKFTDDIVKVTKLLCDVRKEEILKIQPNVVYMKDGIDAMSCVTMEASPTRYCCTLKTSYVYA